MNQRLRGKRTWAVIGVAGAVGVAFTLPNISFADSSSGCDFSPANNSTALCTGPLTGSTFAGGDGNLAASPTTYGSTDWGNVTPLNADGDKASGSGDNAFGQGTKEDNAAVSIVTGSIPPNKSDLTRLYESNELGSNGHVFLYLGWERSNVLGNANMDFEINKTDQSTGWTQSTTGPLTISRSAGDLLVTYDFNNGGGSPTIGLLRWVTTGAVSQCFSANALPCWGNRIVLGTSAVAAVNNMGTVTDPNTGNTQAANTFGEAAIDLTAAGVFQPGICSAFGSAFLKSRSSSSFTAEIKDFIAPEQINLSNCGEIKIYKHTDPRGQNKVFSYTSNLPAATSGGTSASPCSAVGIDSNGNFCLNDNGNTTLDSAANHVDVTQVPPGAFWVKEGTEPLGYALENLSCTAVGTGSSWAVDANDATKVNITLSFNGVVSCTYQNQLQLGSITITKAGKDKACTGLGTPTLTYGKCTSAGNAALGGATFAIATNSDGTGVVTNAGSLSTSNSTGTVCFDGLPWGTYYVTETGAPTGYAPPSTTRQSVSVGTNATCASGSTAATGTTTGVSFTDAPLTTLSVGVAAVQPGTTNSSISCIDSNGQPIGNSPQPSTGFGDPETLTADATHGAALTPGTYTCTVVVDP